MNPLRSMIFTPGHRRDLIEKAIRSGADAVIVDLEDAVAVENKVEARGSLADLLLRTFRSTSGQRAGDRVQWEESCRKRGRSSGDRPSQA